MASTWKGESLKIRKRVLKAVDVRLGGSTPKAGATVTQLRGALLYWRQDWIDQGCAFYTTPFRKLNADQLFQVLYACAWAKAHNFEVATYFNHGFHDPLSFDQDQLDIFA